MTETEYRLNHTTDNEDDDLTVTVTVSLSVTQPDTTHTSLVEVSQYLKKKKKYQSK